MISRLPRLCFMVGWAALLAGLVLQFGIKDRVPVLALLFYAMPKPCLLALAVTLLVWPRSAKRTRMAAAGLAIFLAGAWLQGSWDSAAPAINGRESANEVRVIFWNLDRPVGLHRELIELVKAEQPHIAVFVEPGPNDMPALCKAYEAELPGYQAAWMPRGILWLSRVPSRYRARGKLDNLGAFARFEVNGLGPAFPMVVADVYPHPFVSREGQLKEVLAHAQGRPDAIMVGDFNTPLESVFFDAYRANFTNALEAAGQGFHETWPLGMPLLSLDQLWAGPDWEIVLAEKRWQTSCSDHAALLVTLKRRSADVPLVE